MEEQIVKLTGQPVSEEMKEILKRLANKEFVDINEINNTKEIKIARSNVDYSRPTIQLENRLEIQENAIQKMINSGAATIDENGKIEYNGDVEKGSRLDIVVGLPASGKSSATVDSLSQEFHSKVIDNDEAKKMIPQYNNGWGAGVVHEESQKISDAVFREAIAEHENVILPKVGSNADKLLRDYIGPAVKAGYKVNVHFVDLDRNKALGRMINRFIEEGRFLDPNLIDKYCNEREGNKIEKAYEQLKESDLISGFSKWDNDVERGEKPVLVEHSNLEGNYISHARIGEIENERANEQFTKDITFDSRDYGESRRNEPQGSNKDGRGQRSNNSRDDSERNINDNGQILQINQNMMIVDGGATERTKEVADKLSDYKPLAKVEELEEANYNMIDNVLNNMKPKKENKGKENKERVSMKDKLSEMKEKSEQPSSKKEKVSEISKKKQEISI